jgi:hypothetical protein
MAVSHPELLEDQGEGAPMIRGWRRSRGHGCGCLLTLAFGVAFWAAVAAVVVVALRLTGAWR